MFTAAIAVTADDVMAVVADASAVALDNVIDAAFTGKPSEVETQFARARGEGTHPGVIVSRRAPPRFEPAPYAHRGR